MKLIVMLVTLAVYVLLGFVILPFLVRISMGHFYNAFAVLFMFLDILVVIGMPLSLLGKLPPYVSTYKSTIDDDNDI